MFLMRVVEKSGSVAAIPGGAEIIIGQRVHFLGFSIASLLYGFLSCLLYSNFYHGIRAYGK
jgi:hypothetical protein